MSDRRVRKKRKTTAFSGRPIRFKTNNSPLHVLKLILSARWSLPAGISTLFLMVYVFVYSSDFLILLNPLDALESLTFSQSGAGVEDIRSDNIELFKANIGIGLYVCVLIYSLFFLRPIIKVLIANPHLVLIVSLLLFGMQYSVNPEQVFFSVVQIGIGILIALLYAIKATNNERWDRAFCMTILFPLFLIHLYSMMLFFTNGLEVIDFVEGSARFGGLPGNPNQAGASAVIGVWTSFYLLLSRTNGRLTDAYCVLALCLFVFTIVMSGSGTALTVSIAVVALLIWLKFLTLFKSKVKRAVYIISGVLVMTLLIGFTMISSSTEELTESFTSSLGKQSDFTGRTVLWEIAVAAIEEKPLLGWSYDQHETVQENRKYELPSGLGHFHNGFLDTAVAGGLLLLLVVIWNMFSYIKNCIRAWATKEHLYGFIGPVVVLVLMNLSEYSLLRPLNVVFQFYLCAYFLLLFSVMSKSEAAGTLPQTIVTYKPRKKHSGHKRSSRRGVKYRF